MCYHYKANMGFFLAEHRINKIKDSFEKIFSKLQDAGAELIFMYKRAKFDDPEFLQKSTDGYRKAQKLLQEMEKKESLGEMKKLLKHSGQLNHNILVLLSMIQSAEKFGKVHQINSYDFKPAVVQSEFITKCEAKWVIGLDTYFFLMNGDWKILADDTLDQREMTMTEIDKNLIMAHFELTPTHLPLFSTFLGDFESNYKRKMDTYFGSVSKFENAAKYVKTIEYPLTDVTYKGIAVKIFGAKYDPQILIDLKNSVEQFENRKVETQGIDAEIVEIIKNDFLSYAQQILLKKVPIFIVGSMTDYFSEHTSDYNELVLPWIQKTAGILLKATHEKENSLKVIMINPLKGKYETKPLEVIYPDFDVPSLKEILKGELATYDKEKMLFFVVGEKLEKIELPSFNEHTIIDCLILLFLINKKKITVLEARCILKTIVDSREKKIPLTSFDYPKMIHTRATRCGILYMKLFFELHSCLGALGMKNYCAEFSVSFCLLINSKVILINFIFHSLMVSISKSCTLSMFSVRKKKMRMMLKITKTSMLTKRNQLKRWKRRT